MVLKRILKSSDVARFTFSPVDVGFTSAKVNSGKMFGQGKLFFKKELGLKKKRVFFKPVSSLLPSQTRKRAKEIVEVAKRVHLAGVPVLKMIQVEHEGHPYLAVESFLTHGNSVPKIFPINPKPLDHTPYLLSNISLKNNSALIKAMAQDTAKIINKKISTRYFDFFGFYPNAKGQWERKVMDLDHMYVEYQSPEELQSMLKSIRTVWEPGRFDGEYNFFLKELLSGLKKPNLRYSVAKELVKAKS